MPVMYAHHSSNIVLLFSVTYNYDGEPYVINHTEEKGRVTVNLVRYGIFRNHCFRNFARYFSPFPQ